MTKDYVPMLLCTVALACSACAADQDAPREPPGSSPVQVDDAVILDMRVQTDIALDTRLVEQFRRLLRVARTVLPEQVSAIHARPDSDYRTVGVKVTGEIAAVFDQGRLRTGNVKLDALLALFELTSVRLAIPATPQDPATWYWLTFNGPIQTARLATAIQDLQIAEIEHAEPNSILGDGDDIRAAQSGSDWTITFIHGEGDCPAGCTRRTLTRVLVDAGGQAHLLPEEN
jgi:hypothetical protein